MENLDNPLVAPNPADHKPWPTASRIGTMAGLALVIWGLVAHFAGLQDYANAEASTNWLNSLVTWGITIGAIFYAIQQHRDQDLGGYISFSRGLGTGMLTTLVLAALTAIFSYVLMAFIVPDLSDTIREAAIVQWEAQGMSEEQIEQALGFSGMFFQPGAIALMTFLGSTIFGLIISLIVSAILKKDAPTEFMA